MEQRLRNPAHAAIVFAAGHWLDDFLNDEDDEQAWEKITVNVEEYRQMGDPAFRWHFRLTKPVFEMLLLVICNQLVTAGRLLRERTPMSHIVLMVLWILATPDTFRSVALRFGVYPSGVHEHYKYIIEALRELAPRYITWPNQDERNRIKGAFHNLCGIDAIVGIVDGCHIDITAPLEEKAAYRNYHHGYSIKAQAVCDDRLLVTDLYVGEAGSLHDARFFRRSPLCRNLLLRQDMLGAGEHIIGDSAYTLTNTLLVPFLNNGHLQPLQRNFNRRFSRVRCRIEHTFGHSQCLWRRIQHLPCRNLDYAVDHIVASFVLHNFKILHGEGVNTANANPDDEDEEAIAFGNDDDDNAVQQVVLDGVPDPHVPQGELARLFDIATILGEQKRWDICNMLPME